MAHGRSGSELARPPCGRGSHLRAIIGAHATPPTLLYLLDTNVFSEIQKGLRGHKNVRAWLESVDDDAVRLSVMTIREVESGVAKLEKTKPEAAAEIALGMEGLLAAYSGRVIEVNAAVSKEWGRLVGVKGKNHDDMAFAATARVLGLVLVTRNVKDFRGRGVRVLDPSAKNPVVVEV